jgi:hypothetical protein
MSRLSRLKEYANPMHGPHGSASDKGNIAEWIERATENSKIAPRAKGGEMKLPSTKVAMRDTSMKPKIAHKVDRLMVDKDLNHVGGTFMPKVRRGET